MTAGVKKPHGVSRMCKTFYSKIKFKITNQAIEEETRAALESQSPRVQRPENMEVLPLEESNISEECVESKLLGKVTEN